jgi:uncharacterized membrane protein HdeD (DUF308 family)
MWVGVLLAILGFVAIVFPVVSSLTIGIVLGAVLTVAGFAHVAHAFSAPGWTGALGEVFLAVLFLLSGVAMLANPVVAVTSLTLLLIAYLVVEGFVLLYFAFSLRGEVNWLWSLVSAALSFLVAGLLWIGFPSTAAWAIGLLFGVNLLATGVSMIVVGRGTSKAAGAAPRTSTRPGAG